MFRDLITLSNASRKFEYDDKQQLQISRMAPNNDVTSAQEEMRARAKIRAIARRGLGEQTGKSGHHGSAIDDANDLVGTTGMDVTRLLIFR